MRALLTSDWHWENSDAGGVPLRQHGVKWTCDLIRERKPDLYANLGDSSVAHGWIETDVLHAMCRGYRTIGGACDAVGATSLCLIGNHDQTDREGTINLAPALEGSHRRVVERSSRFTVGDMAVGALAYCREKSTFDERLDQLGDVDLLLVHQDVEGAVWRPGVPAAAWLNPTAVKAQYVAGGHYHHPQIVCPSPLWVIVGSMYYANWHDSLVEIPRGALWWDFDTGKLDWIEFPFGPIYHTVVKGDDREKWAEVVRLANDPRAGRMRLRVKFASPDAAAAAEKSLAPAFEMLRVGIEESGPQSAASGVGAGFGWDWDNAGSIWSGCVGRYVPTQGIDRDLLARRGAEHLGLVARTGAAR